MKTPREVTVVPLQQLLEELYAGHEIFRRLGFASDDIFIIPDQEGVVAIVLRLADKEAALCVGRSADVDELLASWTSLAKRINDGAVPEAECQRMFYGSKLFAMRQELLMNLARAGLLPADRRQVWS